MALTTKEQSRLEELENLKVQAETEDDGYWPGYNWEGSTAELEEYEKLKDKQ